MARQPLGRALVLLAAPGIVVLLLVSLRRRLLVALGHVAGPRRVQRQQCALDQFILKRVNKLFRLQRKGETEIGSETDIES